jgi:hypothetical protein
LMVREKESTRILYNRYLWKNIFGRIGWAYF